MTDMRTAFTEEASALLDEDPLAAVVLAEISADLFAKAAARYPDRVLNVGIREQLMVSVGGGLALAGMRPIMHSYAPFLVERAFEQVKLDLAHQGGHAVLVSIGASYDAARSGRTHQAPEDVALLDTVPGFSVVVPGHPSEVRGLLRGAMGGLDSGSAYLRLSTETNRKAQPLWPGLQVVRSAGGRWWSRWARCSTRCSTRWPTWTSPWRTRPRSGRSTPRGCGRWRLRREPRRLRQEPSCWSSLTWPGHPRSPCLRRWLRGRTGC